MNEPAANASRPILEIRDLRKAFGPLEVLRGITLDIGRGEVASIIGASGSGKSTLLRCVNHLEQPTSGLVLLDGVPVGVRVGADGQRRPAAAAELDRARRDIGMVFQQFNLWPHMTAIQNVMEAPRRVLRQTRAEAAEGAERLLEKVGLADKRNEYPARLSGGQQQRVAIARALAMGPKVMLFDEATSALDPEITGEVLDVMRALADDGMTMLVVTHEIGFAREASTRVIFLHDGRIEEDGPPDRVLTAPRSERCRAFLSRILR